MIRFPSLLLAVFLAVAGPALSAQELDVLGGASTTASGSHGSYTYEVDYLQDFYRNFSASVSYLNEGHVPGHRRDGTALELWGRVPFAASHLALAVGGGVYNYYDTQVQPGGGSVNVHGTAPIVSAAGTFYLSDRWFLRAQVNRINPRQDLKMNTAAVGLGYWFGNGSRPEAGHLEESREAEHYVTPSELTAFVGQSVVNTVFDPKGRAYAGEFRHGLFPHVDWTASYLNEGNPQIIRRNGFLTQLWAVNAFMDNRFSMGIGFGPYFYIDKKNPAQANGKSVPSPAGMESLTFAQRIAQRWLMRLTFNRVASNNNRDADIFLLGVGYRWSR